MCKLEDEESKRQNNAVNAGSSGDVDFAQTNLTPGDLQPVTAPRNAVLDTSALKIEEGSEKNSVQKIENSFLLDLSGRAAPAEQQPVASKQTSGQIMELESEKTQLQRDAVEMKSAPQTEELVSVAERQRVPGTDQLITPLGHADS